MGGGSYENIEIIPKDFQILTYKCLNFLTFLTHTEIWENFSLKPPKIWQFISEKSEIIPKHFENLTYKSLNFLNILIWTPPILQVYLHSCSTHIELMS